MVSNNSIEAVYKKSVKDFDITPFTGGDKNFDLGDFASYNTVSIQIQWENVTGTPNSIFTLQQRNDVDFDYVDIDGLTYTMTTASGSAIIETYEFLGRYLNLNMALTGATGGIVSVSVVAKNK